MLYIRFFPIAKNRSQIFFTSKLSCMVLTKSESHVDPLRSLLRIEADEKLSDHIMQEGERVNDYEIDGNSSSLRMELSNAHRNPSRFQEILKARSKEEIQLLSIVGLLLILEWARKLKLEKCRWETFMNWFSQHKPFIAQNKIRMPLEVAMAAGAHSTGAWEEFVQIYSATTGETPPFDYFVLASYEFCNVLRRAHANVRSTVRPSLEGKKAVEKLQLIENEVRLFIGNGLRDTYQETIEKSPEAPKKIIEIIIRSTLYFRSTFLSIRHLWVNLLQHRYENLSFQTYVFLISTCGTYNRQDTLVSTEIMMQQANIYWEKYVANTPRPLSLDVVFSFLMAHSSCNHPDTAKIAAVMLEMNISSLYKKEILKCALHATAQQQDTGAFIALEEYCKANAEFVGDMHVTLLRRRAHLLSHYPDEEILHFYNAIDSPYRDKYLTDIVFRWLELRTNIEYKLLHSIQIAEEIDEKLKTNQISKTSLQVESLMALYAKASTKKGIDFYLSTPKHLLTQKSVIEVLRILIAHGYTSKSEGQAKVIWNGMPEGMPKLLSRDLSSREVVQKFHPTARDTDDLTRFWFNSSTFDPEYSRSNNVSVSSDQHILWDPSALSNLTENGISCLLKDYATNIV